MIFILIFLLIVAAGNPYRDVRDMAWVCFFIGLLYCLNN